MTPLELATKNYNKLNKFLNKDYFSLNDYSEVKDVFKDASIQLTKFKPNSGLLITTYYGYRVDYQNFAIKYYITGKKITMVVLYNKDNKMAYRLNLDEREGVLNLDKYHFKEIN